jgi:hypothetical protein
VKDNNIAQDKGVKNMDDYFNSRLEVILKRLNEIVKEHPEIVLKDGVYDYSQAPPEVKVEIEKNLEEMADTEREEILWHLAKYYYAKENNLPLDPSLAEFLLAKKENGFAIIPDSVIEDLLEMFPELKKLHPKIYEMLGQKTVYYPSEQRDFVFKNVLADVLEPVFRKIENFAKAGVKGVKAKKENGFYYINYTNAPPEVKKILDDTLEEYFRELFEFLIYHVSHYYFAIYNDPSRLDLHEGNIVIVAKSIGATFVPKIVIIDALKRFPELRKMYPKIAKEYEKFLK